MPEAVIVATARSPSAGPSRARSSTSARRPRRPDRQAVLARCRSSTRTDRRGPHPGLRPARRRAGGYNIARVAAILAGLDDVPGVTVNRYCSSSLQTIRMAAHAIKAGEGDVFIAAGVETVSRYRQRHGASDTGPHNPKSSPTPRPAPQERAEGGRPRGAPSGLPDIYIAMGQTAENVAELEGVSREEMDEFAARSQQRAEEPSPRTASSSARSPRPPTPTARWSSRTTAPRRHHRREAGRAQAGLPPRRHRHRRQRLPAQRRRRRRGRHERHQGEGARHHAAGPHRVVGVSPA
jgi:hypothetical protein